jgi:hypothetical protein
VNGWWIRSGAREGSARPRLQSDACARPLNFTVRRPALTLSRSMGAVPQWTPVAEWTTRPLPS